MWSMPTPPTRWLRRGALLALSVYACLLLAAALPAELVGSRPLAIVKLGAGYALHAVGVTSGLEVFDGRKSLHAIHEMTCFRIVGEGARRVVLYDDLARCRERRVEAVRNPFRILQMRSLSAAFVDLNLQGQGDLRREVLQPLFLFSDFYCHTPAAEQAKVERVSIEALYLGLNLQDGTSGEVPMRGSRDCKQPTWAVGR
jgi:hypothetical protein